MVAVAQLAERRPVEANVAGSFPVSHPIQKLRGLTDLGVFILLPFHIPDRPGRVVVQRFAKNQMGDSLLINIHLIVIAEWEAEAIYKDVAEPAYRSGQVSFAAPCAAAIGRA